MPTDALNMPHRNASIVHLSQGSASKTVGTDPFNSHSFTCLSQNFVSASLVNMSATVPTWEQKFLISVRLVCFQVAFKLGVDLDFPGVLLAFGIDAAKQDFVSNSPDSHHVRCE